MKNKQITQFCKKHNLSIDQFYGHEKINGSLYLGSLTTIPDGFNPTVGGYLYLGSLTTIPDGFNPTDFENKNIPFVSWQGEKYIMVDGLFTEVVNKKGKVWKVKKIGKEKEFYIVTDGWGKYAHGDTIKSAKEDLIYKLSNRNKSDFAHLNMDSKLSMADMIECYRVVTGACSFGVKSFIESNGINKKEFSVSEVIDLTKGQYGASQFKNFLKAA